MAMRVIHGLESSKFSGVVLTVGNFDGVHRGHLAILAAGRSRADEMGVELVAMTFDPHPLAVLTPEHVPAILTPLDQKLRLLEEAGVDTVVMVRSRPEFLSISADIVSEQNWPIIITAEIYANHGFFPCLLSNHVLPGMSR